MEDIKDYHRKQFEKVYRSTEKFVEWLENKDVIRDGGTILDIACGAGANTIYMANKFRNVQFIGIDINDELINYGNKQLKERLQYSNCKLFKGDWFNLDKNYKENFDGIISFQTLSWLPNYKEPLEDLAILNPKWIAISSLFYEGDIEYTIKLKNYYRISNDKEYEDSYYNIYSLIRVREYLKKLGYYKFEYMPFEIDIDLPKTKSMDIGTYTIKTEDGRRLQISAALMMPWYFIVASK